MLTHGIMSNSVTEWIDIKNNYEVIAMANWEKEIQKYQILLFLREKSIGTLEPIRTVENIEIVSDFRSIRRDMAYYITNLHKNGFFKQYIDQYEYILKCFDKGNDFFEQERLRKGRLLNEEAS